MFKVYAKSNEKQGWLFSAKSKTLAKAQEHSVYLSQDFGYSVKIVEGK